MQIQGDSSSGLDCCRAPTVHGRVCAGVEQTHPDVTKPYKRKRSAIRKKKHNI